MNQYTSSVTSLLALVETLRSFNISFKEMDIDENIFEDINNRVDFYTIQNIWNIGVKKIQRDDLGLLVGSNVKLSNLGIVGYIILNSKDIEESISKICAFQNLITEGIEFKFEDRYIDISYLAQPIQEHQPIAAFVSALFSFFSTYCNENIKIQQIKFKSKL